MKTSLMVLGTGVIVLAILITLGTFNDRTVYVVLVPGIVVGLILVVLGMRIGRP